MTRRGLWWLTLCGGLLLTAGCDRTELSRVRTDVSAPERIDFGAVALGEERERELTIVNESRIPLQIHEVRSGVASVEVVGESQVTVAPGATHTLLLRFAPSVEGPVEGAVQLATGGGADGSEGLTVALLGAGVRSQVRATYDGLDFGDVEVDTTVLLQLPLLNLTEAPARARLSFEGEDQDLFVSSLSRAPLDIGAGEEVVVPIAFTPTRLGAARAQLRIEPCAMCEPFLVDLSGNGVAAMLEIAPSRVDFGRVEVGGRADQRVTVRNNGSVALTWRGTRLLEDPEGLFRVESEPAVGTRIAAGSGFEIHLSFSPRADGRVRGPLLEVGLRADNAQGPYPKLPLQGEGGMACLYLEPATVDFGEAPEGRASTRTVHAFNRCNTPVRILDAAVTASVGGYFSVVDDGAGREVKGGERVPLTIRFQPQPGSAQSEGELRVRAQQDLEVSASSAGLVGARGDFAPCDLVSLAPEVDFGRVQVGSRTTRGWLVEHRGEERCFLERLGLAAGSHASFTSAVTSSQVLPPGGRALLMIDFLPTASGVFSALAEARFPHPTDPQLTVPIRGEGVQACVVLEPAQVAFGQVKLGCGAKERQVQLHNRCGLPVALTSAALRSEASVAGELFLRAPPTLPAILTEGAQLPLTLAYTPQDEGRDPGVLDVTTDATGTLSVGIEAEGRARPLQTERFVQAGQGQVDVLFVIDNSGSMMEEQQSLGENFQAFLSAAQGSEVDYQIGVTTTGLTPSPGGWSPCPGGAEGGEAGRLFPVDGSSPRIIRPETPNAAAVFATNVNVGWCHWNEQGLEAAYRALSAPLINHVDLPGTPHPQDGNLGFLREGAKLVVVFLSDEDDYSPQSVSFYETFLRGLKGGNEALLTVLALVGPEELQTCPTAAATGSRYLALAEATGGMVESICTRNWAASLELLSAGAFGPRRHFPLNTQPDPASEIEVRLNGVSVTTGWHWDPEAGAVVFAVDAIPLPGTVVEITYPVGC
ncbi:MAG TPA: choice-of-anchor D domain-containing protein [Myxococcaceae bacterium]|nr:choice-of-anchor D domain-containing protein [Myxococcaceae bacterium]